MSEQVSASWAGLAAGPAQTGRPPTPSSRPAPSLLSRALSPDFFFSRSSGGSPVGRQDNRQGEKPAVSHLASRGGGGV